MTPWTLFVDTHLHFYPDYNREAFWQALRNNLLSHAGAHHATSVYAALLTERSGCDFFEDLHAGREHLPHGWRMAEATADSIRIAWVDAMQILLLPGRQLDTVERLEVLALGTREVPPEGLELREALEWAQAHARAVVLPWAFGKWTFGRARKIRQVLESFPVTAVSDSAMRPWGWPYPRLIKFAAAKGLPVWAGSDPLPREKDEGRAGEYVSQAPWKLGQKLDSPHVFEALKNPEGLQRVGERLNLFEVMIRSIG